MFSVFHMLYFITRTGVSLCGSLWRWNLAGDILGGLCPLLLSVVGTCWILWCGELALEPARAQVDVLPHLMWSLADAELAVHPQHWGNGRGLQERELNTGYEWTTPGRASLVASQMQICCWIKSFYNWLVYQLAYPVHTTCLNSNSYYQSEDPPHPVLSWL